MSSSPAAKFTDRLGDLRTAVQLASESTISAGFTLWFSLDSDSESELLNVFDDAAFSKAFDREEANKSYIDAVQKEDTPYREMQAAKVQGDVLSAMERDLRMRYRGRVRMFAHATARQVTQGLKGGPITGGIENFVKLLMVRSDSNGD